MIKQLVKFSKITFRVNKLYYLVVVMSSSLITLSLIFNMYQISYLIDALHLMNKEEVLKIAGILILINVLLTTLKTVVNYLKENQALITKERLNHLLSKKLLTLPYHYLENTYYLDLKERAKFASDNQNAIGQLLEQLATVIASIVTIISLGIILFTYDYLIVTVIIVMSFLSILVIIKGLKAQLEFFNNIMPINRKYGYYLNELGKLSNAKEYRFSDMGNLMKKNLNEFTARTVSEFKIFYKKNSLYESLLGIFQYIQMGIVYVYLGYQTLYKIKSVTQFTYYTQTIFNFYQTFINLVRELINLKRLFEYMSPFITLIELKTDDMKSGYELHEIETIEFRNVSFKYPQTDNYILKNISFKVVKGEKISIVGLNGAGKTTLIKLLTRLYEIEEGQILINDINIKAYELKSFRRALSTVFQDFKVFAYDIGSNISPEYESEKLLETLEKVDIKNKVESLKNKEKTSYSKEYDENGVMFSGGEEQKLAIARALYKDSSLVILDEPTSALDPQTEANIYDNFNHMVKNKTTIYISHRMSSSTFCDKILVINKGMVESYLPHKELMKNKESLYYQLFMSQAKNYKLTKENV